MVMIPNKGIKSENTYIIHLDYFRQMVYNKTAKYGLFPLCTVSLAPYTDRRNVTSVPAVVRFFNFYYFSFPILLFLLAFVNRKFEN